MTSALPSKPQLGADVLLVPLAQKLAQGQGGTGPRGQAWHGQHWTSPAHGPGPGLCAVTIIPSLLGCSWGVKHPSPGGSADPGNSHFERLHLSPAPCPPAHHAADITRAPVCPSSRAPAVTRDPLAGSAPAFAGGYRSAESLTIISNSCSSNAFAVSAELGIDPAPPFMSSPHPLPGKAAAALSSAQETLLCLVPVLLPSPRPPVPRHPLPGPAALLPQFPHLQSSGLGDAGGSAGAEAGLGAALPDGISGCRAHLGGQTRFARAQQAQLVPVSPASPAPHPLGPSACPLALPAPLSAHHGQTLPGDPLGHPLRRNPPLAFPARHGARRRR